MQLLAQRVAAKSGLSSVPCFLSRFLLYVVAETVVESGQRDAPSTRSGVQVFGRPANYRSTEDNIVRTYARQLRRRLAEYFAGEGKTECIYIDVPLGGYVPVFCDCFCARGIAPGGVRALRMRSRFRCPLPAPTFTRGRFPLHGSEGGGHLHSCSLRRSQPIASRWFGSRVLWKTSGARDSWRQPFDESTAPLWTALFGGSGELLHCSCRRRIQFDRGSIAPSLAAAPPM